MVVDCVTREKRPERNEYTMYSQGEREEHWCDLGQIKRPLLGLGT